MSLGSHIITWGSLSRSFQGDLLAAPRDPLLFLYPRWFSSQSRTSVSHGKRAPTPAPPRKGPTTREGNTGPSSKAAAHPQGYFPLTIRENNRPRDLPIARWSTRLAASGIPKHKDSFRGHWTQHLPHGTSAHIQKRHYSRKTSATNGAVAPSQTSATSHTESTKEEAIATGGSTTSSQEEKRLARLVRSADGRQKHLADKASANLQLKDKSILSFDWRVPLNLLKEHTQFHDDREGERVLVHKFGLPVIAGNVRESLWNINARSGCEVHVLGKEEEVDKYRPVLLRGSPSSIEMAKEVLSELFRQASPYVKKPDGDMLLCGAAAREYKGIKPSLVQEVWTNDRKLRQVRVDDIPRPEVWTTLSFANYVANLIQSTVTRSMQRHLYKDEKPHVVMVRQELVKLFQNPQYDNIISVQAFNNALNFLYKHSMISTMRTLFVRMELIRRQMLPETFNIMLRGAAAQKDLHQYTKLLKLMIQKRHRPTASSWVALMMTVPSRAVQARIESRMREMGLLHFPEAVKGVATVMLTGELIGHLNSGQDMASFIARMDGIYGLDWMSPSSLNRALDVIGERGSFLQASDAIKLFLERNIRPNAVSLNTLLSHCDRQGNLTEAVRWMQYIPSKFCVQANEITYHHLFKLAWKSQQYNTCRVVWRHACMGGAVSYKMQELMLRSLVRNTPSRPKTKGEMWILSAAKVIAGVAPEPGTSAKLIGWSETGQKREENLALAKEVLAQDLAAALHHRPVYTFTQQLTEAFVLDKDWTYNPLWKGTSTIWKIANAINVALIPGPKS